jgi:hypothetical protein
MTALDRATSPFDAIKHTDEHGEHWSARELMPLLGYERWEGFEDAINRAHLAAANSGHDAEQAFSRRAEKGTGGRPRTEDVLASGRGDYSVADAAKILSRDPGIRVGRDRLFGVLREQSPVWTYRSRGDGRYRAYQYAVERGWLSELPQTYTNPGSGETAIGAPQIRVTPKGLAELHRRLGGRAPLQLPLIWAEA